MRRSWTTQLSLIPQMPDDDIPNTDGAMPFERLRPLILPVSVAATVLGLIIPIVEAYGRGDVFTSATYSFFVLLIVLISLFVRPARVLPLQPGQIFRGTQPPDAASAWPRSGDSSKLRDALKSSVDRPVIVVGPSGAGKSILLATQVLPALRQDGEWDNIVLSSYAEGEALKTQIKSRLQAHFPRASFDTFLADAKFPLPDDAPKTILVFDQFEQFLSRHSSNDVLKHWFHLFVTHTNGLARFRHVIVVRKEWYYDLRFLEGFVPPPHNTFLLSGYRPEETNNDLDVVRNSFLNATGNPDTATAIMTDLTDDGQILPVRAQIAGLMLELHAKETGSVSPEQLETLEGAKGLIKSFFRRTVASSPDPSVSLSVLFALSVETSFRRQLSVGQISDMTHRAPHDVHMCLKYFSTISPTHTLARRTDDRQYELLHDFVAQQLHELSGSEMRPLERDNVLFFWEELRRATGTVAVTHARARSEVTFTFGDYVMTFLGLLTLARLFAPLYGTNWAWFNTLRVWQTLTPPIDVYYLPVFISHVAWSIYVTQLYRRVLSLINEPPLGKLLSVLTVINCAGCVTLAVFKPYYWVCSIAWGGIVVGIKYLQLSTLKGLSGIAKKEFGAKGLLTIVNLCLVLLVGVGLVVVVHAGYISNSTTARYLSTAELFFAAVLTYFMLVMRSRHMTRDAAAQLLGLLDRGRLHLKQK